MDAHARQATDIATLPGLAALWAETAGDPRVRVAVVDGPVDQSHPCFSGARMMPLPGLVMEPATNGRMSAHGTHITSMIFARHDCGMHGVAPGCTGVIGQFFSDERQGPPSQSDLARMIEEAVEAGAHVINVSGGELTPQGAADPALAAAVQQCQKRRVLIVAAAGNNACRCLHVPAALPSVLAVGAMNNQGAPLEASNWGDTYQSQGILAPGVDMPGAVPGGGFGLKSGTSFATPIVTGIVALLMSLQLKRGRKPDPFAVRDALLESAERCDATLFSDCERFLVGKLNVPGAHTLISKGETYTMSQQQTGGDTPQTVEPTSTQPAVVASGQEANPSSANVQQTAPPPAATPSVSASVAPPLVAAPRASGAVMPQGVTPQGVLPQACGCQGNGGKQTVFAIGVLGYDFGTEARRDGFKQLMASVTNTGIPAFPGPNDPTPFPPNPYDARQLVNYLTGFPPPRPPYPIEAGYPRLEEEGDAYPPSGDVPKNYPGYPAHMTDADQLIWTLNIELTPIYAIRPTGAFAVELYHRLVEALAGQILNPSNKLWIERISIGGYLTNEKVRLYSGQEVPVFVPQTRGFYSWNTNALIDAAFAAHNMREDAPDATSLKDKLRFFLNRIYYDLRNLGQTSAERALNFAATNVFQAMTMFISPTLKDYQLASITTERSTFCRMDSDCWDVKFKLFNTETVLKPRRVYRYTVDVSDVFPVTIGLPREWAEAG